MRVNYNFVIYITYFECRVKPNRVPQVSKISGCITLGRKNDQGYYRRDFIGATRERGVKRRGDYYDVRQLD